MQDQFYAPTAPTTPLTPPAPMASPRNGYGIAALLLALGTAGGMFAVLALGVLLSSAGYPPSEAVLTLIGLLFFASLGADALALGLGIVGLLQPGRPKAAAVLGLVISGATIALLLLLVFLGSTTP